MQPRSIKCQKSYSTLAYILSNKTSGFSRFVKWSRLRRSLARFLDKKTTFDNYRKEAERLLLWSTIQMGKPLPSLTHEDWLVYQAFLLDPQPRERWVTSEGRKFPRSHPDWKPFAGPLLPASQRQAGVILNSMFSWLVNAGYLAGNPLALSRERKRRPPPRVTRYLDEEIWRAVKGNPPFFRAR